MASFHCNINNTKAKAITYYCLIVSVLLLIPSIHPSSIRTTAIMSIKSSSSPPESLASDRERAIDELVQGRHFAYQLKDFLLQNQNQSLTPPAQDLVLNVLNSFTNTISILNPTHSDHSDLRKSEDSGDSCRSSSSTKYPRGCYKRRKTSQYSWTRDSPDIVDDGNAWRKYGQKQILNAKYPRNYYRCTHKHEQKCEAKKQVQRREEDPPLYRTIYNGIHTCNNRQKANHLYIDYHDSDDANDSFVISFNNNNHHDQNHPFFTTTLTSSMKQDHFSTQNNIVNQSTSSTTSSDYLLSTDDQAAVINNSSSCTTTAAHDDDDYGFHVDHLMEDPLQFDDDDVFAVCI